MECSNDERMRFALNHECQYENWIVASIGLRYTKEALQGFVAETFAESFSDIKRRSTQSLTKAKKVITELHRFKSPVWKNVTDDELLCDTWWLAKCFLPNVGYKNVQFIDDLDCIGMLSIIINCTLFDEVVAEDLNSSANAFTKLRRRKNDAFHRSNKDMTDDELNQCLENMREVLMDSKSLLFKEEAKEAFRKINQLHELSLTAKHKPPGIVEKLHSLHSRPNCSGDECLNPDTFIPTTAYRPAKADLMNISNVVTILEETSGSEEVIAFHNVCVKDSHPSTFVENSVTDRWRESNMKDTSIDETSLIDETQQFHKERSYECDSDEEKDVTDVENTTLAFRKNTHKCLESGIGVGDAISGQSAPAVLLALVNRWQLFSFVCVHQTATTVASDCQRKENQRKSSFMEMLAVIVRQLDYNWIEQLQIQRIQQARLLTVCSIRDLSIDIEDHHRTEKKRKWKFKGMLEMLLAQIVRRLDYNWIERLQIQMIQQAIHVHKQMNGFISLLEIMRIMKYFPRCLADIVESVCSIRDLSIDIEEGHATTIQELNDDFNALTCILDKNNKRSLTGVENTVSGLIKEQKALDWGYINLEDIDIVLLSDLFGSISYEEIAESIADVSNHMLFLTEEDKDIDSVNIETFLREWRKHEHDLLEEMLYASDTHEADFTIGSIRTEGKALSLCSLAHRPLCVHEMVDMILIRPISFVHDWIQVEELVSLLLNSFIKMSCWIDGSIFFTTCICSVIHFMFLNEHGEKKVPLPFIKKKTDHTRWVRFEGEPKRNILPPKTGVISASGSCDLKDQYDTKAYFPDTSFTNVQTSEEDHGCFLADFLLNFVMKLCLLLGKIKCHVGFFLPLLVHVLLASSASASPVERNGFTVCSSLGNLGFRPLALWNKSTDEVGVQDTNFTLVTIVTFFLNQSDSGDVVATQFCGSLADISVLKQNDSYRFSNVDELSKTWFVMSLTLCAFLVMNTAVLTIYIRLKIHRNNQVHKREMADRCETTSQTEGDTVCRNKCDGKHQHSSTNEDLFFTKTLMNCDLGNRPSEIYHCDSCRDEKKKPISVPIWISIFTSLVLLFCICYFLKENAKKRKESVASTSEMIVVNLVTSVCLTLGFVPFSTFEKALAVQVDVKRRQECTLFLGRSNEKDTVIKLQLAYASKMIKEMWLKDDFQKKPLTDKKDKKDEATSKETLAMHPFENIGSCLAKTFYFVRSLCSPYEEFESADEIQSDSSKMGMNTPGLFELCLCGFICFVMTKINIGCRHIFHKETGDLTQLQICDKPHNDDGTANSNMTMKVVVEETKGRSFNTSMKTLHMNSKLEPECEEFYELMPEIIDLANSSLELECLAIAGLETESLNQKSAETNKEGFYQIGSTEMSEANGNEAEVEFSYQELTSLNVTIPRNNNQVEDYQMLPQPSNLQLFLKELCPEGPGQLTQTSTEECKNYPQTWNSEENTDMKCWNAADIMVIAAKEKSLGDIVCNFDENTKKRKLSWVVWESMEPRIKEPRIDISYNFPVKRKNTAKGEYLKRRRLEGVTSRPSDDDYDYCEFIQAYSLLRKRPINADLVCFLTDLLHFLRWNSMGKIQSCMFTSTEDEMHMVKEFFVKQECFQDEASKPIRKDLDPYFIGYFSEAPYKYALPGIDYEIHLPLIKQSRDEQVSTSIILSNSSLLMQKADQLVEMEQNLEPNDRRYTFKIDQPNKAEHKLETERLKEVGDTLEDDQLDDEQISAKLVTPAPSSEDLEQVNTETCNNVKEKQGAIQMQVLPPKFVCQSDVASISTENLQEALTTADSARDETFNNLKNKMVTSDPLEIRKLFGKHDDPDFDTKKTKFAHPEDDEEAVYRDLIRNLPQPQIDTSLLKSIVFHTFDPLLTIIDQIANGTPPTPHVSMRYELLRFCTLRSYPKENKPYLIKLAEAGFYYASDGDGVVCYCCGVRRYNWVAEDIPMKIHQRINPNCKFLRKNEEVNVPVQYFGPYSKALMAIMDIPEPRERTEQSEDVNNDWAPERIRSPASSQQNRQNETGANSLGINTALPKHTQYATKTAREGSYSGWPDTASHTPQELADAGFFYAGFGDCVRCFYCGIGLRHWTKDDNPWIEHARWSRNCVFVKQKKGEEFVNLVQLAVQYSQDNEAQSNSTAGNQLPAQEVERILLSDAAQSVLEMGYQPRIIKKAIEQILRQDGNAKITAQILMEKVLEIEEAENPPQAAPAPAPAPAPAAAAAAPAQAKPASQTAKTEDAKAVEGAAKSNTEKKPDEGAKASSQNKEKDKIEMKTKFQSKELAEEAISQDPKAIKAENEQLKEQTLCKVCLDNTVCIVFLPCGHLVTCADCAPAMRKCPICRALVKGTVRTYMS